MRTAHRQSGDHRRNGMALVLVVAVLATAAVLSYAMLASNTLQAEISSNLMHSAGAEYVAESGINVGMYYLQSPAAAPSSWTSTAGYSLYAKGIPLNDGTEAEFDLTVAGNPKPDTYTLTSTGWPSPGSAFSHTATAMVTVNRVPIPGAGVFGGDISIPSNATFSNDGIAGVLAIQVNGVVSLLGGLLSGSQSAAPLGASAYLVPTGSTVNYYGVGTTGNYLWTDGITLGTPQQITASTLTAANLPARVASNPAGIFYHQGALAVTGTVTIGGTLIVRGGSLTIQGNLTVNPASQFPAVICQNNVTIKGAHRVFTANGVVFLGTGFSWSGTNTGAAMNINGALLMAAGASFGGSPKGTTSVTYSAANANVPLLATFNQPAISVQVNHWTQ